MGRDLAAQGVEFLRAHFRDTRRGGWVWTVTRGGEQLERAKRPYALAFVVYSLVTSITRALSGPYASTGNTATTGG